MFGDEKMLEKKSIVKLQGKNKTKTYSEKKKCNFFSCLVEEFTRRKKKKINQIAWILHNFERENIDTFS